MSQPVLNQIWCFHNCPSKSKERCKFYLLYFNYLPWNDKEWRDCQAVMIEKCYDHTSESLGVGNIIEFSKYSFSDGNLVLDI